MSQKKGDVNPGAVVGLLGFLVFFIGLCGTIGSFLFAAAEGRGRYTVFYGAIVWGLIQIIWGFVLAIRHKKVQDRHGDADADAEEDDEEVEDRRRKKVQATPAIPFPVIVGCSVAGGLLLFGLGGLAVVMIIIQALSDQDGGKGGLPPPPKIENQADPVEPTPEDLGPKEAHTPIAGATNDPTFKDQAPDGGVLVGFDVGLGQAFGVELVRAIQPRYQTPKGEVLGRKFGVEFAKTSTVKAKPGYAVGAINVKAGLVVNGFSATFMRIKGNALDPADSYSSEWIGDQTGGSGPTVLGGDGTLIIGIIGKRNARECNGLGLLKRR